MAPAGNTNPIEEQRARRRRERLRQAAEAESHAVSDKTEDVLRARIMANRQAWTARALAMEQTQVVRALAGRPPQRGVGGGR